MTTSSFPTAPAAPADSKPPDRSAEPSQSEFHLWVGLALLGVVMLGGLSQRVSLLGLGISLSSFLAAYLIASHRHAVDIERLVLERTRQLEAANRRLKEMARVKDEFVALVSHELRTPLAVIREGTSQILEGIGGEITLDQRQTLQMTLKNVDRLKDLIEDLLDISKIEAGKMPVVPERFDFSELIREVRDSFLNRAAEKGLTLEARLPSQPLSVYADRERIRQALVNLIGNAIKFTDRGGVSVSLEESRGWLLCSVSDTGHGIAPEHLPRLFQKFQQFQRTRGNGEKGTGLGLAICKGIVELHGGRIQAESRVSQGTTIRFLLPPATAGFSLVELLLAILLLVTGIASSTFILSRGMFASADVEDTAQALSLAEEKMENLRGAAFGSIFSEVKGTLSGWTGFSREVTVTQPADTNSDLKQVVVTVYWNTTDGELSIPLTSYVANVANN